MIDDGKQVTIDDRAAQIIICRRFDIAVLSINSDTIAQRKVEVHISCLALSNLEEGAKNGFFATGHADGTVQFWSVSEGQSELSCLWWVDASHAPIVTVSFDDGAANAVIATPNAVFGAEACGGKVPKGLCEVLLRLWREDRGEERKDVRMLWENALQGVQRGGGRAGTVDLPVLRVARHWLFVDTESSICDTMIRCLREILTSKQTYGK
jgi:hypothetical protein